MSPAVLAPGSRADSAAAPSMRDLIEGSNRLPVVPALLLELMDSIDKEDSDLAGIATKITRDQALVARVLRLANSPFYGMPQLVGTVQEAIVVLGFYQVRDLVVAASLIPAFPKDRLGGIDGSIYWRHGIEVAVRSRALARHSTRGFAFTAGLLHDVGKLVLATVAPACSRKVAEFALAHDCSDRIAERDILGFSHEQIGAEAARHWRLPPEICEAIEHHHDHDSGTSPLGETVLVADAWSNVGEVDKLVAPDVLCALAHLEVTQDLLLERRDECDRQIDALEGLTRD